MCFGSGVPAGVKPGTCPGTFNPPARPAPVADLAGVEGVELLVVASSGLDSTSPLVVVVGTTGRGAAMVMPGLCWSAMVDSG